MKAITIFKGNNWCVKFKFKIQDMWIGIFWESRYNISYEAKNGISERISFDLYICLVPCFPIHFKWWAR